MRNYILFLMLSINVFSQNYFKTDSIKRYKLVNQKVSQLKKKGFIKNEWLSITGSSNDIYIIWKSEKGYRTIRFYRKLYSSEKLFHKLDKEKRWKKKNVKLSKENNLNIEWLLSNAKIISGTEASIDNCNERSHSYRDIFVYISKNDSIYQNNFIYQCEQKNVLDSVKSLYKNLIRN